MGTVHVLPMKNAAEAPYWSALRRGCQSRKLQDRGAPPSVVGQQVLANGAGHLKHANTVFAKHGQQLGIGHDHALV